MRTGYAILCLALWTQVGVATAQAQKIIPVPATRQLTGLDAKEAAALLAKLQDAQRQLKSGTFQSFEVIVGSIASYDEAKIAPRAAFLAIPFEKAWQIERGRRHASS